MERSSDHGLRPLQDGEASICSIAVVQLALLVTITSRDLWKRREITWMRSFLCKAHLLVP